MAHPNLSAEVRIQLNKHAGAFLLGNTAPDVQVISGQARQVTHFFTLPIQSAAAPPWETMLFEHPELIHVEHFPGSRSAFLAGYLCHLQADWIWVLTLFLPTFGPEQTWETFPRRLYLHNVLRAYLDGQVISTLTADVVGNLKDTCSENWLPFVRDYHLDEWRDFLTNQFKPGAEVKTVDLFASRQGIDPLEFHSLVQSETDMESQVFERLPRATLIDFRDQIISMNLELIQSYLTKDFGVRSMPASSTPGSPNKYDRSAI
jgi:hypothetical protein